MPNQPDNNRVLSGMRPTGRLHLGHYHGVLKNWVRLQKDYDCFYFVADWHALTTHYEQPQTMHENITEMVIDWLASGVDPEQTTMFVQSQVLEHAELHLLLSMVTPLSWLERVPSYKEQQQNLSGLHSADLATYGFLGYPLLQSADILMYRAAHVPVGEDQAPHVELTREIARRFNHFFGKTKAGEARSGETISGEARGKTDDSTGIEKEVADTLKRMGKKEAKSYKNLRQQFNEQGDRESYEQARELVQTQQNITDAEKNLLIGYLSGRGRTILPEPQALLTTAAKMPGLDGKKMSKSYGNAISLRDDPKRVTQAINSMPTDPARVRLTDPGDPDKCPVWQLHQVYSDEEVRGWAEEGCRAASFGCLTCKKPLLEKVLEEQNLFHERASAYVKRPDQVRDILEQGNRKAQQAAQETMQLVREAVGVGSRL